ncbi:MAG: SMI1/KNR4 family protein [Planctomycetaceae bacterium]|nr:SMI1/KNR4 family protein [Planctomycetaceae bacterium]
MARLIKRIPPPDDPKDANVDWDLLEEFMGLKYPQSFKDLISVYGDVRWFDHARPYYHTPTSPVEACNAVKDICAHLYSIQKLGVRDTSFKQLELPFYPQKGGLFPFMIDYSGSDYCWITKSKYPEKWPVYCWFSGSGPIVENLSICEMFVEWLERKPRMMEIWGDVNDLPEERLVLLPA